MFFVIFALFVFVSYSLILSFGLLFNVIITVITICKMSTTTTTTVLRPFSRDHLGELVPEENFWTLWCKGRLTVVSNVKVGHLH